jgi:hypothetical protein
MGMSAKSAITSAAALQWVIKDALGQFGGIITAGLLGKFYLLSFESLFYFLHVPPYRHSI